MMHRVLLHRICHLGSYSSAIIAAALLSACSWVSDANDGGKQVQTRQQAVELSTFSLDWAGPVDPEDLLASVTDRLKVNDGAKLMGPVASSGSNKTVVGVSGAVEALWSVAEIELRQNSRVLEDATSRANISLAAGAGVDGVTSRYDATLATDSRNLIDGPLAGTLPVNVPPDSQRVLLPGQYGDVVVSPRAQLVLQRGEYAFKSLTVSAEAVVKIDHEEGSIGVFVHETVNYSGRVASTDGEHPQWVLVYTGSADLHLNTAFTGAVLAPNAKLSLTTAPSGTHHAGQFHAKSLEVHQHQTVIFRRFEGWESLWSVDDHVVNTVVADALPPLFPADPAGEAMTEFVDQAFERSDAQGYADAKAAIQALPVSDVVAAIHHAFAEFDGTDATLAVAFAAGVLKTEQLLPLYRSILEGDVPGPLLTSRDAHDEGGNVYLFLAFQTLTNLRLSVEAGVPGALDLMFVGVTHPVYSIRRQAVFEVKGLSEEDPALADRLEGALLAGDEDLLDLRPAVVEDLAVDPPAEDELDTDGPATLPGPSEGGSLPDCENGENDGTETGVDCGGPCEPCSDDEPCSLDSDCASSSCQDGFCGGSSGGGPDTDCVDMGTPGADRTIATSDCAQVQAGYPSWWGTSRAMQVQLTTASSYPIPFSWSNACSGGAGTGNLSHAWQSVTLSPTSAQCATVIHFQGEEGSNMTLRYFGY